MIKLFDTLDETSGTALARQFINIGNVYRIKMNEKNGIKPKPGDNSRNKYFIVLGIDHEGIVYGGVIINSKINPHIPMSIKKYHVPIECSRYSFLDHDSFVDCSKLKTTTIEKFGHWQFLGALLEEDVQLITATIQKSPNETNERLIMFGLCQK